ncbi:caspase-14-like isoform X2 [Mytilus californianus]|uniref:caspase-14-like isoform X2 n=1 Tax=Mytilus californianus TaxID=6549 RepID=UPI0022477F43|nr:caspase-14-like isoform X2 [Mytilus californianus]
MDAKEEAKDLHAKLTSDLNEQFGLFESDRYEQFVNRLKAKLSPKASKEAKNIMDILEALERNGTIGPGNYKYLKSVIRDYDVRVVADLIEPTEREIQKILSRGQGTSASGSTCYNNEGQYSVDGKLEKKRKLEEEIPDDNRYVKERGQKGYMLILNVISKKRSGSENDIIALESFFRGQLGFTVNVKEDVTKDELLQTLTETKRTLTGSEAKKYYCFICVVMSHGEEDGIKTIDGQKIKMDDITAKFKNTEFKDFIDKPKIFIVQTCRGKPVQPLAEHVADDEMELEDDFIGSVSVPKDADILLAYATTDGHLSFRHKETGSWFIDALVKVLKEKYENQHFEEMLTGS